MFKRYMIFKAFTLAEVLITLGIIGVVAALTIPTLMNKVNDLELKTAWKKQYSVLSQATELVLKDNGGTFVGTFPAVYGDGARGIAEQYRDHLSYTNYCDAGAGPNRTCWHPLTEYTTPGSTDGQKLKLLNGVSTFDSNIGGYPGILLKDGAMLLFHDYATSDCKNTYSGTIPSGACGDILVDVNGFKKPNTLGKDIFYVWITAQGIKPRGFQGDTSTPSTTCVEGSTASSNTGDGCAAKYLYE